MRKACEGKCRTTRLFLDDKVFDAYVTCEGIHFFRGNIFFKKILIESKKMSRWSGKAVA